VVVPPHAPPMPQQHLVARPMVPPMPQRREVARPMAPPIPQQRVVARPMVPPIPQQRVVARPIAAVADRMVAADIAAGSSESSGARKQEAAEHNSSAALHYSTLRLGSFAWFLRVALALVGTRFAGKRKIWGARPFQTLPFSPPAEKRDHGANNDYQHGKRNQEP
jgi:hypothetical protein